MASVAKKTVIYLMRNDLRLHDNECLQWANRNADHLIPLYCFDPSHYKGTHNFGFPKTDKHRAKFLIECIDDLRCSLTRSGSNLIVRHERPSAAVESIINLCKMVSPVSSLVYQQEVTKEELDIEKELQAICKRKGIATISFWGSTLFHPQDIPFSSSKIPNTYTSFRKGVESGTRVRDLLDMPVHLKPLPPVGGTLGTIPTLSDLGIVHEVEKTDERSAFSCRGGETAALERLNEYLWKTDAVATYKETRNQLVGLNYSTKFSPWLASGSLSPREIHHSIKKYERERKSNQSTYWVIFELMWRDYFKFVCQRYGNQVFYPSGIMRKKMPWKQDMNMFNKWRWGQTGVPFVDANMRELLHTGWMSNRGRQNVASFLVKDLKLDWRLGAEWFESQLIDHDVCSNYGNWNYAAGIGNDPRENRKFNIIKQSLDYDKDGEFVRMWVSEIGKLKGEHIHYPWALPSSELHNAEIELDSTYPMPMITAPEWNKHIRPNKPRSQSTQNPQRGIGFYFKSGSKS